MKYYAIKEGKKIGIYDNWEECKNLVSGYKGAVYKSFSNYDDAVKFLEEKKEIKKEGIIEAYVDGSYNAKTDEYSFGAVLLKDGETIEFKKKFLDEFRIHRNVAGEVKGAAFIINYCIKNKIDEINLYYDYEGIEKWYKNIWKANKELTIEYQKFASEASKKIKVNFCKVKSHSNDYYNDMVDRLAKEALGI